MKPVLIIVVLLCAFGGFGFFCYHKGQSDASAKAEAERLAELEYDSNSDATEHSAAYSLGYTRGHSMGRAETRSKDFTECGDKLAYLAVESGNTKLAAKYLVEAQFAPSQLQAAVAKYNQRPR